jgi:hypothetical protein
MNVTQIKDEIRHLSQSDKIESIHGSLETASDLITESDGIAQPQSPKSTTWKENRQ